MRDSSSSIGFDATDRVVVVAVMDVVGAAWRFRWVAVGLNAKASDAQMATTAAIEIIPR